MRFPAIPPMSGRLPLAVVFHADLHAGLLDDDAVHNQREVSARSSAASTALLRQARLSSQGMLESDRRCLTRGCLVVWWPPKP
jgi:hypothetical protein